MAAKITDQMRERIAARISELGPKWSRIAREFDVSPGSAKAIGRAAGLWIPVASTEPAALEVKTEQRRTRARELAERLSVEVFEDAAWIREKFRRSRSPTTLKALVISAAILLDKGVVLANFVAGEGEDSKGAIITLVEQIRAERAQAETS